MPAIVTATVIRWRVVDRAGHQGDHCVPCVAFEDCEMDCFYIGEGGNVPDQSPIIAQYILKKIKANPQVNRDQLLSDAANGLLQVVVHNRVTVAPPPVPVGPFASPPAGPTPKPPR